MFVIKRTGKTVPISFDKILRRYSILAKEPYQLNVDVANLSQEVISGLKNNMKTSEIDRYAADVAASRSTENRDCGILAKRIIIDDHHKNTLSGFYDKVSIMYLRKDEKGEVCPLVSGEFYKFVKKNKMEIQDKIDYRRDYNFDFFGFKTLERAYLIKVDGEVVERPQDLIMRVAIFIHMDSKDYKNPNVLELIFETYDMISNKAFIHATPTLFNAGTIRPQLASCFLMGSEDSLSGIMKSASDCAQISKYGGGIGIHVSDWRSSGSLIRGTNGMSSGIVPFLKIFNDVARAFNQGGKRLGSFAIYLEMHHADIADFLRLRKNHGDENTKTRDLFLALWMSDLFMERVLKDEQWSVFDPNQCSGLSDAYGDEYKELYEKYEKEGNASKVYKAREIWELVYLSQKESGLPYIVNKDKVNALSNQKNLGTIKSSNLCAEIVEYTSPDEYAVCNLASVGLPSCVIDTYSEDELRLPEQERRRLDHQFPINPKFDYKKLMKIVGILVVNLNKVIDKNWYPTEETYTSSSKHRPIGIGVQGLADVFYKFGISFESDNARMLNKKIFETIYYSALSKSTELSKAGRTKNDNLAGAYSTFTANGGCPLANGIFHWELCGLNEKDLSGMYDWESLREHIKMFGVKNSLLVALMPTASTSQILGNNECFETFTSNIYKRKTLAGEFIVINKYLVNDLVKLNIWSKDIINYMKINNGSIQGCSLIPEGIRYLYKTVWEIKQKVFIRLAAERQPFVDQSQSLNLFMEDLTMDKFNSLHFAAWRAGLKTCCYYMHSQAALTAQKFTVKPTDEKKLNELVEEINDECLLCSS